MSIGVPGEEIDPTDFENPVFSTAIELDPPESAASIAIKFNHNYTFYIDNTGVGAAASRFWFDTPDGAQLVIGPRAGASLITDIRLRTGATVATAANMFIDSTTYKINRSTSSLRYKQDVEDLTLDADALRALRPVKFRSRQEVADRERYDRQLALGEFDPGDEVEAPPVPREYWGLIAEEVHGLGLTGFVQYLGNDADAEPDGIMYDRMIIAALQLLKQQQQVIDDLAARVATLEER